MASDGMARATRTKAQGKKPSAATAPDRDEELESIVAQEEKVLARVSRTVEQRSRTPERRGQLIDYDAELIALRDQIRTARLEDVPPLIEEMERLQRVAQRRAMVSQGVVDPSSPYFGRLVLEEDDRKREVLIGRTTFLDPKTGVRIVDWRDAPVSRIYYRYEEGDDYDEFFGNREVEGEVLVRRSLSIGQARLKRVGCPQGTFIRKLDGTWRRAGASATKLSGGQGAAMRPEKHHKPTLGIGADADERGEDKSLGEITALIDPRQFELISKPTSGLVVIQGGAGSGKTTIGLHRLAYLVFQDRRRFRADKMLVVVFNDALVRYISKVLPALGVEGVQVMTYERWAAKVRLKSVTDLPTDYAEDTPSVVTRLKKHPVMLRLIDEHAEAIGQQVQQAIVDTAKKEEGGAKILREWRQTKGEAAGVRIAALRHWLGDPKGGALAVDNKVRHAVLRALERAESETEDIVGAWAEVLTDVDRIKKAFAKHAPDALSPRELEWAHSWCARKTGEAVAWRELRLEGEAPKDKYDGDEGIDGQSEQERPTLDREDDAILLRLHQALRGPLMRGREKIRYEHIFVDETQDVSPLELAVVLDTVTEGESVTLAGDVAQKLYMDNGFRDWGSVLGQLGLDHVKVEPLNLSYRSTHEILDFATDVLGPLRNEVTGKATRHGAPVELFRFTSSGEAVGFLSEALRNLVRAEPLASVAVIARYPEQADTYYKGLERGEVPNLRRIADQDFPFRPGIDVTDVRQVKGLEFDYVVIVDANTASFPEDDEARHLMHIASTRAAHQLWVVSTGSPSMMIPEQLRQNA
jgi:DNA helicase-2/ATP-dependent DNA helicase PcrA